MPIRARQTLRATIEWSHELLTPDEQRLFARLAVFAGSCTLEAAEAVVDADIEALQSLVDKSLLRHTAARFWMLETILEFATQRLDASGEANELRRRHAAFFLALAEEAEPHLRGPDPATWLQRLGPENDNFRAALSRLAAWADGEGTLRLAGALDDFWCPRTEQSEGRRHLEAALRVAEEPSPARAKALIAAAHLARDDDDPAAGQRWSEEGLELSRALADRWSEARSMLWLGLVLADQGDFARARTLFSESAVLSDEVGDAIGVLYRKPDAGMDVLRARRPKPGQGPP